MSLGDQCTIQHLDLLARLAQWMTMNPHFCHLVFKQINHSYELLKQLEHQKFLTGTLPYLVDKIILKRSKEHRTKKNSVHQNYGILYHFNLIRTKSNIFLIN